MKTLIATKKIVFPIKPTKKKAEINQQYKEYLSSVKEECYGEAMLKAYMEYKKHGNK